MKREQFELHAAIEERHWWFLARRRILGRIIERILPAGGSIVDIGCGTGANIAALADRYKCYGLDTSPEGIDLARQRFPQVEFTCGQAPDAFGPPQLGANLFLLTDVIEHIADDFAFFSKILQSLRPGSHILLTVPADETLWSEHDVSFGHFRRYDLARLAQVWEGLPVTVRLLSHFVSRVYPMVKAVRWFNQRRGRTGGMAGTDFKLPPRPLNWMLEAWMAGEAGRLVAAIDDPQKRTYRRGVSLIALLQREVGEVTVRSRPDHVAPDRHQPSMA